MLHVCNLALLEETTTKVGASHLLSVIAEGTPMRRPQAIHPDNHLFLGFDDVDLHAPDFSPPQRHHVECILDFGRKWPREKPLVVHCWAGISRSTAAAYAIMCALYPDVDEDTIAERLRKASPTATPNKLIVRHADDILGRRGRMVEAIAKIGRGADLLYEAKPFTLWFDELEAVPPTK